MAVAQIQSWISAVTTRRGDTAGGEEPKSGIKLTNRPPRRTAYESALKLELPEDEVLPYEWPQESDWYWRVFGLAAAAGQPRASPRLYSATARRKCFSPIGISRSRHSSLNERTKRSA